MRGRRRFLAIMGGAGVLLAACGRGLAERRGPAPNRAGAALAEAPLVGPPAEPTARPTAAPPSPAALSVVATPPGALLAEAAQASSGPGALSQALSGPGALSQALSGPGALSQALSGPGALTAPPPPLTPRPSPTLAPLSPTATPPPPTATPAPPSPTPAPDVTLYDPARLRDRLGSARTSYAGSIPERAWNVELAARRLDGTRVPPGEVFSFNRAVGQTTLGAGFRIGYGITMGAGRPQTVPSVAGGICQVATTVFQAAFWAGLPFVERHHHLYWIARYGQPPSGRTGLDATVDDPSVDLRFGNTTGDWIRLDAWTDGANVGFTIVGVDPGWQVEATTPRVYDLVRTVEMPVRQVDWSLPPGRELWVEHAEDGFRIAFDRLVKLGDEVVDEHQFANRYMPARNVILVGVSAAPARPSEPTPAPAAPEPDPVIPQPAAAPPAPAAPPVGAQKAGAEAARRLESAGTGIPGLRPAAPRKR